jgi:LPXTG-site transpeptidase (sortase) family protein
MGNQTDPIRVDGSPISSRWILILVAMALGALFLVFLPWGQAGAAGTNPGAGSTAPENPIDWIYTGQEIGKGDSLLAPTAQDLSISKSHQGDFRIGSTGVYTIAVSNAITETISGPITVTDILTTSLAPVSASGSGWDPCGFAGQTLTCIYSNTAGLSTTNSLPPLRLTVNVLPSAPTVITNTASVTNTNDTNASNNQDSDRTLLIGADLAAGKTVTPSSPSEGSTITYTVTAANLGPNPVTGVVLTDTLPAEVTYVISATNQGSYSSSSGVWTVGDLAAGAQATLRIVATVDSGTAGDTVVNTVSGLRSNVNDFNLTNNTASASFTVAAVQATGVTGRVTSRQTNQPISGALVQLQDSSNTVYSFTTGANGWYTFTQTITTPIKTGSGTVRASKSGYVSFSATVVVLPGQVIQQNIALDTADLVLTKTASSTTVIPGQILTYTLTINNAGTAAANSVAITDVLPSQLTYISDTSGITHTVPAALTYVWRLKNPIAANTSVSFKLRVSVAVALPSPVTALTNSARVTTQTPEANTTNNTIQIITNSTGTVNPGITLSVSPNQIKTNQNATYTIKVSNTGTAPMTTVVVEDTFSTYLDITKATTTLGTATVNSSTRKVTVTVNTLNANQDFTISVVVRANATATTNQTVTNSARLTYIFGGATGTRTSASVSLSILATSTLPGTGGIELSQPDVKPSAGIPALIAAMLLGMIGLVSLGYAYWARSHQPDWSGWSFRMGLMLMGASLLFGLAALGLHAYSNRQAGNQVALLSGESLSINKNRPTPIHTPETLIWPGGNLNIPGSELDQLPDFPIPTPTAEVGTPQSGADSPDTSPVKRLIIPALALDTVVKYVPYDGLTWMIAGLQQEVAWLGDTSWPGLGSNTALAAHVTLRTGLDGPFRYLSDLRYGDTVFVETEQKTYEYKVKDTNVVEPTDLSVLEPSSESQLTLITCTEWDAYTGFYTKRLVVLADLIGEKGVEKSAQGN